MISNSSKIYNWPEKYDSMLGWIDEGNNFTYISSQIIDKIAEIELLGFLEILLSVFILAVYMIHKVPLIVKRIRLESEDAYSTRLLKHVGKSQRIQYRSKMTCALTGKTFLTVI